MRRPFYIHETPEALAAEVATQFARMAAEKAAKSGVLCVALSGGSTPRLLFQYLASPPLAASIPWGAIHFFWGDERCVPPDHPDSNYGMARRYLLEHISIPEENVHRIRGEAPPEAEAARYTEEIHHTFAAHNQPLARFHLIYLGMGTDGHTASLFPGSPVLGNRLPACAVAEHPESGQKRITFTLPLINQARRVLFLVSGKSKAKIVAHILGKGSQSRQYPAARVKPPDGSLEWHLDKAAASLL